MEESKVDVLIIGAGPAGLMCANALAHAKIPVRIIDKRYVYHLSKIFNDVHVSRYQPWGYSRRPGRRDTCSYA